MSDWLTALDLKGITLFCQDWGGLIGLRLVAAFPERFARLVIANTGLPIGTGWSEGFKAWLEFSQKVEPSRSASSSTAAPPAISPGRSRRL
jgi:haloalkane dehalogenase